MSVEYLGLSKINGPLAVLEGVRGAAYDEIVEMTVNGSEPRLGRIIEIYDDRAVIQVYEGTDGMALVTRQGNYYFTDSRYTEAASRVVRSAGSLPK